MNKAEFISELSGRLTGLPKEDADERLTFYGELIDDRVEDGLSEEEAVALLGSADEVCGRIMSEMPSAKPVGGVDMQKRSLRWWEIALIVLGSPLWLSLLLALFAVLLAVYVTVWAAVISFWAVFLSLAVSAAACLPAAAVLLITKGIAAAGVAFGAALLCGGLAILLFIGCRYMTVGVAILSKKLFKWVVSLFAGKEREK